MDRRERTQYQPHGSQASQCSSSIASQVADRSTYSFSNATSQLPQYDRDPGSQGMPSSRPRLPPEVPSSPAQRPGPQCLQSSGPLLSALSSGPYSPYASDRIQEYPASLESQNFQRFAASQDQYSVPSSSPEAVTQSYQPFSQKRYGGGDTTTCFSGVESSHSGHGWQAHNGDGPPLAPMNASGRPVAQMSYTEPYSYVAEQSNEQGPVVLSGVGSWPSHQVPSGVNISDIDRSDVFTVDPSQLCLVPMDNNPASQGQGTHSQEIDYPIDQCARGIDPSLQTQNFPTVLGSFVEDANKTNTNACGVQNEGRPLNAGNVLNHCPSTSSASAILPQTIDQGTHSKPASELSWTCSDCGTICKKKANKRRHIREHHENHEKKVPYKCLVIKDGVACTAIISLARNRRKHVETVHPKESTELPPKSTNRRRKDETDEMLNKWFEEVPKSSAQ